MFVYYGNGIYCYYMIYHRDEKYKYLVWLGDDYMGAERFIVISIENNKRIIDQDDFINGIPQPDKFNTTQD